MLLAYGRISDEIGWTGAVVFVALWLAGFFGLPLAPWPPARDMFMTWVAVLDIVLVFLIFGQDIPIT